MGQGLLKPSDQRNYCPRTYGAFDALWEEKPLVDGVDRVVGIDIALPLEKDGPGVEAVVSPEHCESALSVSVDQRPTAVRDSALKPTPPRLLGLWTQTCSLTS